MPPGLPGADYYNLQGNFPWNRSVKDMKLISWNVNGIRACLDKGFLDFFRQEDADFFCIQETKMQPGQADFAPEGYTEYTYSAEKKGYSGTACWCREQPLAVTTGIGIEEHDHEGRVLTLEYPAFWLGFGALFLYGEVLHGNNADIPRWRVIFSVLGLDGYLAPVTVTFYKIGEWFLGVILILYLVFPLLLRCMETAAHRRVLALCMAVLAVVWPLVCPAPWEAGHTVLGRLPAFALGVWFGTLLKKNAFPSYRLYIGLSVCPLLWVDEVPRLAVLLVLASVLFWAVYAAGQHVPAPLCPALRRLAGWKEIDYTLRQYIEKQVQERYFEVGEKEDYFSAYPPCTVWPELRPEDVDEGLLRFACYVAVCCTVYGQSFEYLKTEHILGLVSQLRPDMVKQLKTAGSGKLPKDIQRRKTEHFTASANDAFATIRITARDCGEGACEEALSYLIEILEQPEFPRSYSIEFRGPEKIYLPIPGLPKKGVHQLFACAVRYPRLHVRMENYARLAMQEDEWYNNLSDESCAMPGTFAVFALGLEGPKWWRLVCDYLDRCDDEHSSLQEKFIHTFFKKYGFTAQSLPVLVHGVQSMQNLKPAKEFRTLIANEESLDALMEIKGHLEYYLPEESGNDKRALAYLWRDVLWAIWGTASENGGSKVIKTAPKELKEKYQQVFA